MKVVRVVAILNADKPHCTYEKILDIIIPKLMILTFINQERIGSMTGKLIKRDIEYKNSVKDKQ